MKKSIISLIFLGYVLASNAQAPQGINYQAALRSSSGVAMINTPVTMRFGIYSGIGATLKVYEETQSLTTNSAGIINCVIGRGTVLIGSFSTIAWGTDIFSLKTESNSGSGFVDMGTQQFVSVPYALNSGTLATTATIKPGQITSSGADSGQVLSWSGTTWTPTTPITEVTSGNGLSGGGTSGNITLNAKNTTAMWNADKIQGIDVAAGATTNQVLRYNGSNWIASNETVTTAGTGITISSGTINIPWTNSGNNIFNNNAGNVGIGTSPSFLLDVGTKSTNARIINVSTGLSNTADGAMRCTNASGVFASAATVNNGIYANTASSTNTSGAAIFGDNGSSNTVGYAAYFTGRVSVSGILSKGGGSFKIDHPLDPENKFLYHSFVESPDMMNIYNGNVTLDEKGTAIVTMPAWFQALNMEFRYQLTCIGGFAPVFISEKMKDNQFKIAGGTKGIEVSWQVTGIRQDVFAMKNRIQVEVNKTEFEKGYYQYPIEAGQPKEKGISYKMAHDQNTPKIQPQLDTTPAKNVSGKTAFKLSR